jgi:hypothetical protein
LSAIGCASWNDSNDVTEFSRWNFNLQATRHGGSEQDKSLPQILTVTGAAPSVAEMSAIPTALFAFVMTVSWLALLLAELGKFSAWPCLIFGAVVAVLVVRLCPSPRFRILSSGAAVALIALATLVWTRHPGEVILGGWDPGVYMQTAAHVARTGELLIREADLNRLTPDELAILTRTTSGVVGPFSGMWMLPDGRLSPQFHHLYPSLMAVAFSLGGVKAALMVNPLLNAGCIIAMFALARRFVRPLPALGAAVLLALNPAQLWQAKFCTAETLGQFLLLGGAVFFLDAMGAEGLATARPNGAKTRRLEALLAGAAFGLALLARYDSILLLAPLFALTIAAWVWLSERKNAAIMLAGFAPFLLHHMIHHRHFAPYYQPMSGLVLIALAACVGAAVAVALVTQNEAARKFAEQKAGWLRALAALAVLAWWCFVWARPHLPKGSPLAGADAGNLYFLGAIFGPLFALFAISLVVWIFSERNLVRAIWLYASTAALVVVTTSVFNDHFLMWVSRRFVPVAVPLLALAFVKALERIVKGRANVAVAPSAQRRAVAAALLVAAIAANFQSTRAMAALRDWPGLADWTARVAQAIPADARVFCDQWGFAAPLRFLHGRQAYELHLAGNDPARREKLATVMTAAAKRGERVFFLTMNGPLNGIEPSCVERGRFPLQSQRIDSSPRTIPRTTRQSGGGFVLYEVQPRG